MAEDNPQPDERPRPKYGELAPPGWVWKPPADQDRLDTARPNPTADDDADAVDGARRPYGESGSANGQAGAPGHAAPPAAPHATGHYGAPGTPGAPGTHGTPGAHGTDQPYGAHGPYGAGVPGPGAPGVRPASAPAPRWNLTFTILLIAFGFFGMSYSVMILQAFPASMQLLHSTQGLGDFTPAPEVGTLVTVGTLTMTGLWAISTGLSVWQLVRRRMSFYIPLIAGIVALVALFVFLAVVLSTDPALIDFYSGVMPASPAPSAPATP